ncbi:aminopeptidase [Persicitalea jodogahamensis]|uniref:Aminopeptidase n=1 Tax=Persicitalea jodogahamensis TaxID=402147 RepID=A0A8J3D642_9BACT|nr:aminopeptidase [Persicitalea jodogahamensis]GHB58747.1 aminopeptidase [Persicitalea jodogahamensis]
MLKKLALWALFIVLLVALFYRDELQYGWMQASGQISILMKVADVEDVLESPTMPDSLKDRIRLIEEIKQYGVDSLGLNPSDNYTTFYDQHGKPILWVITAAPRYKLEAREWKFPIIGAFPYKGFFDEDKAKVEESTLVKAGYDTDINQVSAWSTLGYLKDPILSSMLYRSEGSLANLILHELTHGTLFVKGNLELNENLASFVGDWGAVRFLTQKYGADSEQLRRYEFSKKYNDAYAQHVLRGATQLDSLYATFADQKKEVRKDTLKRNLIRRIVNSADTLLGGKVSFTTSRDSTSRADTTRRPVEKPETKLPNNAYFVGYKTYKSKQNEFRQEFVNKFGGDFKKYMAYLKEKYPSL